VVERGGLLPELPRVTMGIIAREDLDTTNLTPLIDSVEHVLTSAA
jgi:hypothetical protein